VKKHKDKVQKLNKAKEEVENYHTERYTQEGLCVLRIGNKEKELKTER
jgi:hypothetical protein